MQVDLGQKALAIGKAEQLPLVAALQHEAQGVEHGLVIVDQIERGRVGSASQFLGVGEWGWLRRDPVAARGG